MLFLVTFCYAANMGFSFPIIFYIFLLLVFKGAIDFCVFTLYLSLFLNSLISVNGILIDSLKQCSLSLSNVWTIFKGKQYFEQRVMT